MRIESGELSKGVLGRGGSAPLRVAAKRAAVLLEVILSIGLLVFGMAVVGIQVSFGLQAARIVDIETGTRELPVGETGELVVQGPQVMQGYWNKPEETAQALRTGWLHTGDIAKRDEEG